MKFKSVPIHEIFTSPSTNSGLKRNHVEQKKINDDYIPVYSATKDVNYVFGWVPRNSKWKKYSNLLTWVKDGSSSGFVQYRKDEFVPYEKLKLLQLKPEFTEVLSYEYLKSVIQNKLLSMGFGFGFKCSMERVLDIEIKIPINDRQEYDLSEQMRLYKSYNALETVRRNLEESFSEFENLKISIDFPKELGKYAEFPLTKFFDPVKGKAIYTQKYIRNNQGEYPVYSSQTTNDGSIGFINSYDHDRECLTWTTDGIYAGTIFYRNGRFSMTTHCGALFLKEEFTERISLKYIYLYLLASLREHAVGEGNKRLTVEQIEKITILLPVSPKGEIEIFKQNLVVEKYFRLYAVTDQLNSLFSEITESVVEI